MCAEGLGGTPPLPLTLTRASGHFLLQGSAGITCFDLHRETEAVLPAGMPSPLGP